MNARYDLVVIGAGSAGLVAATFAARIGAKVALIERDRIGGDCTWTGCVPSKALLKAAKVAHEVRRAADYGVEATMTGVDMARVAAHVKRAIEGAYAAERPAVLAQKGIDVVEGSPEFLDRRTVRVGDRALEARRFLICTGARPAIPAIPGLSDVPYVTYQRWFENERLPAHLLVLGAGPLGLEMALAYRRLGADVSVVGEELLGREEPEVRSFVAEMLGREGVRFLQGVVREVRHDGARFTVAAGDSELEGDALLVATGRKPNVEGLHLERAGVAHSADGVTVDRYLRTNVRHVYAAGDVVGGPQFTHLAGWQAFQAVRNALLPGRASGVPVVVPWVTFLDPEVARVGLAEAEARARYGDGVRVHRWDMARSDRAIADVEARGFIKVVARPDGRVLGASVVASRAGELIGEYALAIQHDLRLGDLAGTIHAYPTWSTPLQEVAAEAATGSFLAALPGRVALRVAGLGRR